MHLPSSPSVPDASRHTLDSWKEIASYLGRGVRTVQRWEKEEQLPVYRHEHSAKGTVFAYQDELDAWKASRISSPMPAAEATRLEDIDASRSTGGAARKRLYVTAWSILTLGLAGGGWVVLGGHGRVATPASRGFPLVAGVEVEEQVTLSPDGAKAAYLVRGVEDCNRLQLRVQTVEGAETARTFPGACEDHYWPRWSPDGRWIAYGRVTDGGRMTIYRRDISDGMEEEVFTLRDPDGGRAVERRWGNWTPDGKHLLVSDRESRAEPYSLWMVDLTAGTRQVITAPERSGFGDRLGAISPDGRWLAVVRGAVPTEDDLWVIPMGKEGTEPRRLTEDALPIYGIAWTPDGKQIVFSSRRKSTVHTLWRVNADQRGAEPQRIAGVIDQSVWPSVSPVPGEEGIRIAYQSAVRIVNLRQKRLSGNKTEEPSAVCPSNLFDWHAQFSPEGKRIAFSSSRDGASNIWICETDTGQAQKVTSFLGAHTDSPRWSPDGKKLVFTSHLGESREVFEVDLNRGWSRPLTSHPGDDGRASYSRDGQWLYFRSNRSGRNEIWKMSAAARSDSGARQITQTGAMEGFESPDGKLLYFVRDRPQLGVWSVPVEGGAETAVTGGVQDTRWAVARDGIYYISPPRPSHVMRFRFDTRTTELVYKIPDVDGIWAGFSAQYSGGAIVWPQLMRDSADLLILDEAR